MTSSNTKVDQSRTIYISLNCDNNIKFKLAELELFLAPYNAVTATVSDSNTDYCLNTVIMTGSEFQ